MTRRWPDISKPRGNTSTSTAIGAGLGMLAGVIVLVIVGLMLAIVFSVQPVHARDLGQWKESDAYIGQWFRALKQPDNKFMSCCGEADAYWAGNWGGVSRFSASD
jgi:hypothetical protein